MKKRKRVLIFLVFLQSIMVNAQIADLKPEILNFEPFIWQSETPEGCPFKQSNEFSGIFPGLITPMSEAPKSRQ